MLLPNVVELWEWIKGGPGKQKPNIWESSGILYLGFCFPSNNLSISLVRVLLLRILSLALPFWALILDLTVVCFTVH